MTTSGDRFLVRAAVAPVHGEARVSSPQISQYVAGQIVDALHRDGDWLRVRGADAYEGWMHAGYLTRAAVPGPLLSLGCVAERGATGARRALPLGARLDPDERVASGEAIDVADQAARFPRDADAIVRTALAHFAGTSYLWGGVTPWGADCSGLVQTVFALHGVQLPRDAYQQAECGAAVPDPLGAHAAADLLFFSDRPDARITHVGIAVAGGRMVHLALGRGGYAVDTFADTADGYVRALGERFVGARRVV
jgi:gamma-D-glutamyl-L-lysine dipeptidyl-peptidase